MPIEALRTITDAEESAQSLKLKAAAKAKQIVADAQKTGEDAVATARMRAEREVERIRSEKAEQGKAKATAQTSELDKQISELRRKAEGRLDEAAQLIVERIVNS